VSNKKEHSVHLSALEIKQYLSNELEHKDMHRIERHILNCSFCNEAMMGYESIENINISNELDELRLRIDKKTHLEEKDFSFLRVAAIAFAIIVSSVFIGNYFYSELSENQFSENHKKQEVEKIESEEEEEEEKGEVILEEKETLDPNLKENNSTQDEDPLPITSEEDRSENVEKIYEIEFEIVEIEVDEEGESSFDKLGGSSDDDFYEVKKARASSSVKRRKAIGKSKKSRVKFDKVSNVKGKIVDQRSNEVLPFVSIINLDRNTKAITDLEGNYEIEGEKGDQMEITYLGYTNKYITIKTKNRNTIKIQHIEDMGSIKINDAYVLNKSITALPSSGASAYQEYLTTNIIIPEEAKQDGISGKVTLEFQVDAHGNRSNYVIINSLGHGCDEEAIRLIIDGPTWNAAIINGKETNQSVRLEINFK
jgi:TonB family protein